VLRHLEEYFGAADVPRILDVGLDVAEHVPFGGAAAAAIARRNIARMAGQFIVGADAPTAAAALARLWRSGRAFTVDVLGEKTLTADDADRYAERVSTLLDTLLTAARSWPADDVLERDDFGPLARVNVSVKPTALAVAYHPLSRRAGLDEAKRRLRPILRAALGGGAAVNFDMEHYEVKDLTLQLFAELTNEDEFAALDAGIAVQAYLKDSRDDLADLVARSSRRATPFTVRLVKGAYWDTETVIASAAGWPCPVFEHKGETDANYERCVRLLHDHHGEVRAAFASHNMRAIAYAVAYARGKGIPDLGYELQMLHGMASPMQAAVQKMGLRLRVYTPVGELVPGMAYLVRRLLENTSNESFVRRRFVAGENLDDLIERPAVDQLPAPEPPRHGADTDPRAPGEYRPEPVAEWRRARVRATFAAAVERAAPASAREAPPLRRRDDADRAVVGAAAAWPAWRDTPATERAATLFRAASWMRARRDDLAALEVFEAFKPWAEADADVCEAIDFCEYYGRQMLRLARGGDVQSPPGERNVLRYEPRGVAVVISPWNFPLAIPTGMVVAALVAGNTVVFKPAEHTPVIASRLVEALAAAGLPPGVLQFVPGLGEEVGAPLVAHPETSLIAFTGSKTVGLEIVASAAVMRPGQRHVKRVIAEMGGKNAIVVDDDVDLDQAVPAIVTSAFGYSGQKCSACSRLVVVASRYEETVARVVGAARELAVGDPAEMGTEVGPLIDDEAYEKVRSYVVLAPSEGRVVLAGDDVPSDGRYVGPTIVADVAPGSRLATEEIFGPVLAVLRASSFEDAIAIANMTDYALTAGVMSRSPSRIALATARLRAGNVYVNRSITGAVVGRQPFGGHGLSGVGSKAGGPDYLLQFLDPRVVTENTMRQGFAPDDLH
jgi:RHH-type proline utilization regulon transcriptional repressor/proline dehydrogenase/delta 1-pyrroline-5-carboxylate dehydrogenase